MKNKYMLTEEDNKIIQKVQASKQKAIGELIASMGDNSDPSRSTLGFQRELCAEEYPDRVALLYEDKKYTHKEFNEWINRYANYFLNTVGLKKGDILLVFLENRPEMLFIMAAVSKIGVIGSLLNTNVRKDPLIHCMKHTPGDAIIIGEELIPAVEDVFDKLDLSTKQKQNLFFLPDKNEMECPKGYINLQEELKNSDIKNPPTSSETSGEDICLYIFTSGTTGLPKAAIISNTYIVSAGIMWAKIALDMTPEDVMYITTPLFHSNAILVAYAAALMGRSAVAIRRKLSATQFWQDVRKFKATSFNYVGEICRYLYNQPQREDDADNAVVKIVGNGLRNDIWKDFKKRFGIQNVMEFYGATENNFPTFVNLYNLDCTVGAALTPVALVEYNIDVDEPVRDEETGYMTRVKEGEPGLLLGPVTPENFDMYKEREDTEKKTFRDVFEKGDMFVNTGDLLRSIGYSHMQFVDRLGDTFRWKGENVSTEEVESVVNLFEQIEICSVYGVLIPKTEGRAGMVSIVKSGDKEFDLKGFYNLLKEFLPSYAIPVFIRFKEEFEVTVTLKIKKINMKKEEYDLNIIKDPLFVMLPGTSEYISLTEEIYDGISKGKYNY